MLPLRRIGIQLIYPLFEQISYLGSLVLRLMYPPGPKFIIWACRRNLYHCTGIVTSCNLCQHGLAYTIPPSSSPLAPTHDFAHSFCCFEGSRATTATTSPERHKRPTPKRLIARRTRLPQEPASRPHVPVRRVLQTWLMRGANPSRASDVSASGCS